MNNLARIRDTILSLPASTGPRHLELFCASVNESLNSIKGELKPRYTRAALRVAGDLPAAFLGMKKNHDQGVLAPLGPFMFVHRRTIIELAATHRIAAIYENRGPIEVGGLISYGVDTSEMERRAAGYMDKILKGAKPGDLPIEQPTKFELVINLKTAKVLGLTIPQSLLQRADQVIE